MVEGDLMQITRETVAKILEIDVRKIPELVSQGKLKAVSTTWGNRKLYDRNEVLELAKKLKEEKEL